MLEEFAKTKPSVIHLGTFIWHGDPQSLFASLRTPRYVVLLAWLLARTVCAPIVSQEFQHHLEMVAEKIDVDLPPSQVSYRSSCVHLLAGVQIVFLCEKRTKMMVIQWEVQDPKIEVLIWPYFGGISPYIGLA